MEWQGLLSCRNQYRSQSHYIRQMKLSRVVLAAETSVVRFTAIPEYNRPSLYISTARLLA